MTAPRIIHLTRTTTDRTPAVTLCGISVVTDLHGAKQAQSGPWLSCPLCEAALALADGISSAAREPATSADSKAGM